MKILGEIYGSAPGGADILKNTKGYYTIKYNIKTQKDNKSYLSKTWKPNPKRTRILITCTRKNKKGKWIGCINKLIKTKKNEK